MVTAKKKPPPKAKGRLKVFMTQIGFHKWLVAAPSQKAALAAWDVRENLFAIGSAEVVTDAACIDLAMKTPGVPVPVDAEHAFAKASKVMRLDDHRKPGPSAGLVSASSKAKAKPKPAPRKRKIDRSRLDKAEEAMDAFKKRALRERAAFVRAQKAMDRRAEEMEQDLDAEQATLEDALEAAREAYEADVRA